MNINIDWNKWPEDAELYIPNQSGSSECAVKFIGETVYFSFSVNCPWTQWADQSREAFLKRFRHVFKPVNTGMPGSFLYVTAWNGEGLPPVGLDCEWYCDSQLGWQKVVVLAYSGDSAWIQPEGRPSMIVGNPANFRPIRTPEQIAAEERASAVSAMLADAGVTDSAWNEDPETVVWAEALYDAGYRKQAPE